MHLRDSNKWDGQPRLLTDEEIANPIRVVHEVFDYAHLPDLRNTLWEWLKTTISGNFNKRTLHYKDRESLLTFYEKMQKLLEASHLLLVTDQLQNIRESTTSAPSVTIDTITLPEQQLVPTVELVPIINKLVSLLSPELMFDMGKIQDSDSPQPIYHFLMVLPNTATCTYAACQALAENACIEVGTIRLYTVKKNEMERDLKEGHLLYAALCQEERLIYVKDNQNIPFVNTIVLPQLITRARYELDAVLHKAESFHQGSLFFLQQHNDALAVFHFQQAIEHCLRGFLLSVTGRNHVTHDLVSLRRHTLPFFPQLVHLLPIEADIAFCLLHQVSKAYVQTRYENNFRMPVTEVNRLKQWVETLLLHTKNTFENRMNELTKASHHSL